MPAQHSNAVPTQPAWVGIITLFPDMFQALSYGVVGRAIKENRLTCHYWNPRDFTTDKHRSVDDTPYGGGAGMLMMAEPLALAIEAAKQAAPTPPLTIYLSPQGRLFEQAAAARLSARPSLLFIAGRYEGVDERIITQLVDEEWSIGDYILTGGELPAMVMIDTITRLMPGVVGDSDSIAQDSLTTGLLKYPQYTRPESFRDETVPQVLLSGNHAAIRRWRLKQSLGRTWLKRRDLLERKKLNAEEKTLLDEYIQENH
jgi:tRNA (guanine37-N1)-methyltransferase